MHLDPAECCGHPTATSRSRRPASPIPYRSSEYLLGVVYAEGWEVMVDAAHLSWALIDPAAGGPAGEWMARRAAMRRGVPLPAPTMAAPRI
ncbi:MAG: hypothetical protein ACRDZR_04270 [Acidimicrobiales bacterium]